MILANPNMRLKEIANGVIDENTGIFYKFKSSGKQPTVPGSQVFGKANSRLYIRSMVVNMRVVAGDTTTYCLIMNTNSPDSYVLLNSVPSVAAAYNFYFELKVLLDRNEGLKFLVDAVPTDCWCTYIYAEIDDI